MMSHHPTHLGSGLVEFVHGAMIVLAALATYGLAHMALRRGIGRPAQLMGLIAWGITLFATIGAATIDGFLIPALAAHPGTAHDAFVLAWELNQAFARLGVAATGAALLLWSYGFLAHRSWAARLVGGFGVLLGAAPVALLALGSVRMNVAGALLVYSGHALWMAMLGLYLWSGRFETDRAASVAAE